MPSYAMRVRSRNWTDAIRSARPRERAAQDGIAGVFLKRVFVQVLPSALRISMKWQGSLVETCSGKGDLPVSTYPSLR